jgi:hypothetical protein
MVEVLWLSAGGIQIVGDTLGKPFAERYGFPLFSSLSPIALFD